MGESIARQVGLQVPRGFHPEVPKEGVVWEVAEAGRWDSADLCTQLEVALLEGHAMPDHIHVVLSIPPKFSVAHTIGFLKGKSAIRIHRELLKQRRMTGLHFWAKGYCVSTIGLDEETIRAYVREQEKADRRQDGQLELWDQP